MPDWDVCQIWNVSLYLQRTKRGWLKSISNPIKSNDTPINPPLKKKKTDLLAKQFWSEILEYSVIDFMKRNSVHPAETEQRKRIKEMSQKEQKEKKRRVVVISILQMPQLMLSNNSPTLWNEQYFSFPIHAQTLDLHHLITFHAFKQLAACSVCPSERRVTPSTGLLF